MAGTYKISIFISVLHSSVESYYGHTPYMYMCRELKLLGQIEFYRATQSQIPISHSKHQYNHTNIISVTAYHIIYINLYATTDIILYAATDIILV